MESIRNSLRTIVPTFAVVGLGACLWISLTADAAARWRELVLAQSLGGLALVCLPAAFRDGYGLRDDALFDFKGRDTNILSVAGALILLPSIATAIIGNPTLLRAVFIVNTVIFAFKACYVEYHRLRYGQHMAS